MFSETSRYRKKKLDYGIWISNMLQKTSLRKKKRKFISENQVFFEDTATRRDISLHSKSMERVIVVYIHKVAQVLESLFCICGWVTVFVLIAAHARVSAHPSYFVVTNHLPKSIHETNILSSIWLGISLKMAQIINFWVDPCNKYWNNKRTPEMTYLRALGAYWNEYGTFYIGAPLLTMPLQGSIGLVFSGLNLWAKVDLSE